MALGVEIIFKDIIKTPPPSRYFYLYQRTTMAFTSSMNNMSSSAY